MQKLYSKLKEYTIDDAIKIEETDRQFIALQNLLKDINNKEIYLALIITNAIICYQLSGKGEDYWEEFGKYFSLHKLREKGITKLITDFVKQSTNNKRFLDTKIKRLEKLKPFLEDFIGKQEEYFYDMEKLRDDLARTMKQKKDAKTIVFAVKMFGYGARNIFKKTIIFPKSITVPIDSRLTNLYERYKTPLSLSIEHFYLDLSEKLDIPQLHLDAIVWVNYNELIK